ncbi:hypothetical protein CCZ01_05570 [Helicobacter monodelphidis]|uniref:bifunctional 2-C-methyl-D-erythritol 4-phosphate cytidylyltransferase/2-C-methyl-D-erythritol 2,4-cyclodiphosphate synthase n=1 Tax=Helicobacter sp. 15-1451 TaxID=2004995 RepID=UPI000DCD15AF|nr:bifunctional 2-C-methyl-D-erythritol 4-phosphate cytidylyltransferase/2-C-methyl-D-erythritol 2,4-cyclodiphosphate synthase [Helicobacter sp. 15-1451]RAX57610.1 hypothetical protein CCZ01_05570 [Helicobacter sp. 15-1451]
MDRVALVLLGAGEGSRFKKDFNGRVCIKKQWLRIGDIPLWRYVAEQFQSFHPFSKIVVVLHSQEIDYAQKWGEGLEFVAGGETRQQSLLNALNLVDTPFVLVNDVARFQIDLSVLERIFVASKQIQADCIVPFLKVVDTIYSEELGYLNRQAIKLIQTPQLSRKDALVDALKKGEFNDESSAIYANGGKIHFVQGSKKLEKLTNRENINLLETLCVPCSDYFIGNGFDVHRFKEGDFILLCGIKIPFSQSFEAHSDGDVALHSLIDALLGAAGAGDIGEWFSDSDECFKGADSSDLTRIVVEFIKNVGFDIVNIDITIIAQAPKITPFKEEMKHKLASLLHIPQYKINIKATTTEKLGFLGRNEGIAVLSTATLKFLDWRVLK